MDRTEKQRAFIIHFLYFVIVAGLVLIFLKYVIYEIMPFLIGFAIAFLLQPLIAPLPARAEDTSDYGPCSPSSSST